MVSLSIMGMPGWVNPFCLTVQRPGTLSVAWRRSAGAFFVWNPWGLCSLGAPSCGGRLTVERHRV
jgi:hypothetical protein